MTASNLTASIAAKPSAAPFFRELSRRLGVATLVASASLATFACAGGDSGDGALVVTFQLGNGKTCDELGVANINVRVTQERQIKQACSAGNQVRFSDLPAGTYDVQIEALNLADVVIMNNGALADHFSAEVLPDNETQTPAINLTNVPAHLYARWIFDGGYGNCINANVESFQISAWDVSGSERLHLATVPCDAAGDEEYYRTVEDPERKIDGRRFGEVSLQALRPDKTPLGTVATFKLMQPPGAGYFVKLTVDCVKDMGCTPGEVLVLP